MILAVATAPTRPAAPSQEEILVAGLACTVNRRAKSPRWWSGPGADG